MASIFDKQIMSDADIKRIDELGALWQSATDQKTKDQIHQKAEAIRLSYGYSGGDDGYQFILNNQNVHNTAAATNAYTDALKSANEQAQKQYKQNLEQAEDTGKARLKEAYVKNMQDSLGIDQQLKKAGITGGVTESTRAYMTNIYNNNRNDIIDDVNTLKSQIMNDAKKTDSEYKEGIAKAEYDGALKRSEAITDAEQFEYKKQLDEYKKSIDERDFEYKKLKDELDQKASASKSASKSSSSSKSSITPSSVLSLMKAGIYDKSFAGILGVSDDEVKKIVDTYKNKDQQSAAWRMLQNGIYDDSFPEILGYSEEVLLNYVNSVLNGF